jgi:hypothetical protein
MTYHNQHSLKSSGPSSRGNAQNKTSDVTPNYLAFKERIVKQETEPRYYFLKRYYLFTRLAYAAVALLFISVAVLLVYKYVMDSNRKKEGEIRSAILIENSLDLDLFVPKVDTYNKLARAFIFEKTIAADSLEKNIAIQQGYKIVARESATSFGSTDSQNREVKKISKLQLSTDQSLILFADTTLILGAGPNSAPGVFNIQLLSGTIKTEKNKTIFSPGVVIHTPSAAIPDRGNLTITVEQDGFFTTISGDAQVKILTGLFYIGDNWFPPIKSLVDHRMKSLELNIAKDKIESVTIPFIYSLSYRDLSTHYLKVASADHPLDTEQIMANPKSSASYLFDETLIELIAIKKLVSDK